MKTRTVSTTGGGSHLLLSEGSFSAKIYRSERKKGGRTDQQFNLVYSKGGRRRVRSFGAMEAAKAEAELVLTKLANGETQVLVGADPLMLRLFTRDEGTSRFL